METGLNLIGFIKRIGRYRLLVSFMLPNSKRDKNVRLEIGSKGQLETGHALNTPQIAILRPPEIAACLWQRQFCELLF